MMLIFTIFGAIIADTWLGLYRSVISMSFIYILGLGIISVAMIELLHLPIE
jgi:dipeptide/tripeptide permease